MKIDQLEVYPLTISFTHQPIRPVALLSIRGKEPRLAWGEIAPLASSKWLDQSLKQLDQMKQKIVSIDWRYETYLADLKKLSLLPPLSFALESALLDLLDPLPDHFIPTSALLMGSYEEILMQAELRSKEGFRSAKLKVSNLQFEQAADLIGRLKNQFHLRVDVNRAWNTSDSLRFFSQFPLNTFDYVEEPFQNPYELKQFKHPLAIDESFLEELSLEDLASLPNLKALVYKPSVQGGLLHCLPVYEWTQKRGISLVLSSSFESDVGLIRVASMAYRLSIKAPIGIGTYHYLTAPICFPSIRFVDFIGHMPKTITLYKPL